MQEIQIPLGQGINTDGIEAFDRYPTNFLYNPKPGEEHLEMMHGLEKVFDIPGLSRGGVYAQTDWVTAAFRVVGNNLIQMTDDGYTLLDTHKIPVFTIKATSERSNLKKGDTGKLTIKYEGGEAEYTTTFTASGSDVESSIIEYPRGSASQGADISITSPSSRTVTVIVTSKDANNTASLSFKFVFTNDLPENPTKIDEERKTEAREKKVSIVGDGFAKMIPTNQNLAITTNGTQYLYNETLGLRLNPAKNKGVIKDTCYMNNRLIDVSLDSNGVTYVVQHNPGQDDIIGNDAFGTTDAQPDEIIGIERTVGNQLLVLNRFGSEKLIDAGAQTEGQQFTLQRIPSAEVRGGLISANLKVEVDNVVYVVGGTKKELGLFAIGNGKLEPAAPSDFNSLLDGYTQEEYDSSWLEYVHIGAHKLILIQLPNKTLVMDLATGKPSVLATGIRESDRLAWRASHCIYDPIKNRNTFGDKLLPIVGSLSKKTFAQYGETQEAVAYTPRYDFGFYGTIPSAINIKTVSGNFPSDYTQRVFVSMTTLGATDYGNEVQYTITNGGNYGNILRYFRIGRLKDQQGFRLRITSDYRSTIGNTLNFEVN